MAAGRAEVVENLDGTRFSFAEISSEAFVNPLEISTRDLSRPHRLIKPRGIHQLAIGRLNSHIDPFIPIVDVAFSLFEKAET